MNKRIKVIRSLRVVNDLTAKGHRIIGVEPCRKSPRYTCFIFEDTPALQEALKYAFQH
ncbi:hypothetical protein [Lysinibacillus tabacifolii]|uniref:hypothetical protein n=1 Tax=Lysinibacillus tabacifolii TaxID=1173107 RepID=UPI00142D1C6C|nr:hypothetical protein [Lysinibacillus tabacifolii]